MSKTIILGGTPMYRSNAITLSDNSAASLGLDVNGNLLISLGTQLAGEDLTNNVQKVEQRFSNANITSATTTTVKSVAGYVDEVIIAGGTLGNVTIYDNTAASGTLLCPAVTPVSGAIILKHCTFSIGLTIVTAAATVITVSYR